MALVVFCTALATLAIEVFYTRLFAALFWKDTAFAILSLAMLGIGASGVAVYLKPAWSSVEGAANRVASWLVAFGISIVISYAGIVALSKTSDNMLAPIWGYGPLIFTGLVPFFCGGMVLSIIFSAFAEDISRLYLFDLAGAAVGAATLLPLLSLFNGPGLVPVLSFFVLAIAAWFAGKERLTVLKRRSVVAAAAAVALWGLHLGTNVLGLTHSQGKAETDVKLERWDPLARITVRSPGPDWVWINIDSRVVTPVLRYDGNSEGVSYLRSNVLQLAYHLKPYDHIVIIGPGGGSDVLSALIFGNHDITAVEVNRTIINMMRGELADHAGHIYDSPDVHIRIADGRAFVAGMHQRVDLIQATFIDTVTAANSGAHTLSENYLYTTDAARDFLDHLTDNGVLSLSRWGGAVWGWAETHRAVSILAQALRQRGIANPGDYIVAVRGPSPERLTRGLGYQNVMGNMESMTTVLVKKSPFAPSDLDTLERVSRESAFEPLWMGSRGGSEPVLKALLQDNDPSLVRRYAALTGLDISPVNDDRPFFFDMIRPIDKLMRREQPEWTQNPSYFAANVGVSVLYQLLASTTILALLLIIVPLLSRFRDLAGVKRPVSTLGYFVCLGLGYIGIEISLMQRFALLLEHPVYAMVVVLGAVLVFSGLGSLSTRRVASRWAAAGARRAGLLVLTLSLYGFSLPFVTRPMMGLALPIKIIVAVLLSFPPAFLMGMLFPIGIGAIRTRVARLIPWVWGLNAAFSVLGAILSLYLAMSFGHTVTWYAFVAAYAFAGLALIRLAGVEAT